MARAKGLYAKEAYVRIQKGSSQGRRPNTALAESEYSGSGSDRGVDFIACGFKFRENGTNMNNGTYVYAAFAKHPLVSTGNVPSTAR